MIQRPVLIDNQWRDAQASGTFQADAPATKQPLPDAYPISTWADIDAALDAATRAAWELRSVSGETIARFLERYAERIEAAAEALVAMAHAETALPVKPRLADVELPRTTGQLRSAAKVARSGTWQRATLDTQLNIRSLLAPLGPVWVFGPNNFPFAFNSVSGGDFAAAIATGCPVIAKANSSHPGTTRLLAELAQESARETGLPSGTVQLLYRTSHADGARAVADPRTAATGYTGSRHAGLELKAAADAVGKPIYLELSSINPVLILPGAIVERGEALAAEFAGSCLMGTGQFCTNPGLVIVLAGKAASAMQASVAEKFRAAPVGTLLSKGVAQSLAKSVSALQAAGAHLLAGGTEGGGTGYSYANTLLAVSGEQFLKTPEALQTEAFGNVSLWVTARDTAEAVQVLDALEGNLTGCVYSDTTGQDDSLYAELVHHLRPKVGRLLNDKMPTGVAVSSAMNHGGPYPATGHPHFTAVGIPAALDRFTALECYDNVRADRLPVALRNKNPNGAMWRLIDGSWTQADVS